jgi:hypothetical protein
MKKYILILAMFFAAHVHTQAQAHGDDHKDHAHAAPAAVLETNASVPTLTTQSEQFEIVARLYADELGLYIDYWASNAPVLNAQVEVELNGKKAIAKFHTDHGDYAVSDPEMLKALRAEGEHSLIFSIVAGPDADLLTGELHVHAQDAVAVLKASPVKLALLGMFGLVIVVGCALGVRHLLRARKEERA